MGGWITETIVAVVVVVVVLRSVAGTQSVVGLVVDGLLDLQLDGSWIVGKSGLLGGWIAEAIFEVVVVVAVISVGAVGVAVVWRSVVDVGSVGGLVGLRLVGIRIVGGSGLVCGWIAEAVSAIVDISIGAFVVGVVTISASVAFGAVVMVVA